MARNSSYDKLIMNKIIQQLIIHLTEFNYKSFSGNKLSKQHNLLYLHCSNSAMIYWQVNKTNHLKHPHIIRYHFFMQGR